MSRNVIRDGYTRTGYIRAAERQHDEMKFEYRPMLPEEVELCEDASAKKKPREAVEFIAAMLTGKLVSWSEETADAKVEPITLETVRRLHWVVLNRLYRIVAGMAPSDPLPDATQDQSDDYAERLIAAAKEGRAVGVMELEAAEKN